MKFVLETRSLTKRFGAREVLADVSLALPAGTITVLLGENGAGKSTLLKLALGVLRPCAGRIEVCGRDPRKAATRRSIGFVPDRPDCYAWMTPRELFRFLAPQYPTWSPRRLSEAVERLGVPMETRFADLSRGEGAKSMLAAALAQAPALLLLDEPFAGLDPLARDELLRAFLECCAPDETTALIATHDLDVAARVADRVALLADGRIEVAGRMNDVLGAGDDPDQVPARLKRLFEADENGRIPA